jgi:hypothetical protein
VVITQDEKIKALIEERKKDKNQKDLGGEKDSDGSSQEDELTRPKEVRFEELFPDIQED